MIGLRFMTLYEMINLLLTQEIRFQTNQTMTGENP